MRHAGRWALGGRERAEILGKATPVGVTGVAPARRRTGDGEPGPAVGALHEDEEGDPGRSKDDDEGDGEKSVGGHGSIFPFR